jgi:hypothetical protein
MISKYITLPAPASRNCIAGSPPRRTGARYRALAEPPNSMGTPGTGKNFTSSEFFHGRRDGGPAGADAGTSGRAATGTSA